MNRRLVDSSDFWGFPKEPAAFAAGRVLSRPRAASLGLNCPVWDVRGDQPKKRRLKERHVAGRPAAGCRTQFCMPAGLLNLRCPCRVSYGGPIGVKQLLDVVAHRIAAAVEDVNR